MFAPAQAVGSGLASEIAGMYRERRDYYAALVRRRPSDTEYLDGWDNRIAALEAFALKLAGSQG